MSKKFLVDIDLAKNQIINVVLHNRADHPTTPVEGQLYYNTVKRRVYIYENNQWYAISGNIRDFGVVGGGLNFSLPNDGEKIELSLNLDAATLDFTTDGFQRLRVKDGAVTTAKLGDGAVTTVKLADRAITFQKIQDVATMTVLGRVQAGSGSAAEVAIITDLNSASGTTLATSQAIKAYIDSNVTSLGNLEGSFNASAAAVFPTGTTPQAGTRRGDYWYVSGAGTVQGITMNIGDVLVANKDGASPTIAADWFVLESNRDQATTSILGVVMLASAAEVQAGTDTNKVVTPATLAARTATESRTGIAAVATTAEAQAGTDDTKIITALKLKAVLDNRTGGFSANIGNNIATSFAVSHGLNTLDVVVEVFENATGESVIVDIIRTSVSLVNVVFAVAPATNAFRVVIKK